MLIVGQAELLRWLSQITGYANITSYTNLVDGVAIMKYIQNTWPATCRKVIVGRFRWNPDNLGHYQDNWDMIQECFELLKIPGEIFDFPRLLGGHSKSFYHLLAVFYYIGAINAGTASTVAFKHPLESEVLAFLQSKGVVEVAQTERKRAILGRRGRRATVATPSNLTLIEDNEDEQGDLNFSSCDLARLFAEGSRAGSPTSGFRESGTKISMLEGGRPPPGRPVMKSRIFDDSGHEAQTPCKTQSSVPKQPSKFSITSHFNSLLSSPSSSEAGCKNTHTGPKIQSPTECPPRPSAGSESCTHPRQSTLSPTPSEHSRQETREVLLHAPDNESSLQASLEGSHISCVSVQHNLITSELMRSSLSGATQPLLSADVSQLLKSKPVYPPLPSQNSSLGIHLTLESRQSRTIPSRTISATDDTSGNPDQPAEQSGLLLTPPGAAAVVTTKNPCSSMLTRTTDSPSSDDSLKLSTTLPLTADNEKKTPRECPPRWPQKKEQLRYSPIECTSSSPDVALPKVSPEKSRDRVQVRVEPPVFGSDQTSATDDNIIQYSASGTVASSTGNVFRSPQPQAVNASVSDLPAYGDPIGIGAGTGMGGSTTLARQLSASGDTGALSEYLYNPSVLHLKEVEPYPSTASFGDVDSVAMQMRARSNTCMRMSASRSTPSEQHLVDSGSRVIGDLVELERVGPAASSKNSDVLGSGSAGPTLLGPVSGHLNTSCGVLLNDASPLTLSQVSTPTLQHERMNPPTAPLSMLENPLHKVTPPSLDSLPHHDVHSGMVTPRANWMDTLLHQDSIDPLFNISLPSRRVHLASSPEVSAKSHCDPASESVDKAIEFAVHQRFESLKAQLMASAQQLQSYGALVHALERAADLSREELGQIRDMYESRLEALQELSHSKAEILARSLHLAFLRSAEEVGAHSAVQSLLSEHEAQLACHEERLRTYEAIFTHDLASLARFERAYDQLLRSSSSAILKAANESLALELKEARKEIATLTALIEASQNDSKPTPGPEMDTPESLVMRSLRKSPSEKPVQIPAGALAADGYLKALLLSTKLLGRLETAEKEIEGLRGWASVFDRVNAELVELALRQQEKEGDCKTIEAALAAYADNIQKVRATLRKPVGDDVAVGALVGLAGDLPAAITEILTKHRDALCSTLETDSPVAPHILNCILDVRTMAGTLETAGVEDTPQARIDLLRAISLQLLSTNAILRDRVSILEAHVQAVDEFLKDNRAGLITSLVQSEECQSRLADSLHADVADVRAQCEQEVRDMKQAAVHLLTENEGLRAELAQYRTLLEEGNSEHLASLDAGALHKTCISLLRGLCMLYHAALTESGADQSSPALRPYLEEAERLERELETRKRQAQVADGKTIFASLTSAQRALRDELTATRGELAGERDIVARQAAELEELRRQAAALEQENRALRVQQAAAGFATQLELLVTPV